MSFPIFNPIKMNTHEKELQFQRISKYYGTNQLMKVPLEVIDHTSTLWNTSWVVPYTKSLKDKVLTMSQLYKEEQLIWIGEDYSTTPVHVLPNPFIEINSIKDFPELLSWLLIE